MKTTTEVVSFKGIFFWVICTASVVCVAIAYGADKGAIGFAVLALFVLLLG